MRSTLRSNRIVIGTVLALVCLWAAGCSVPTPTATFKTFYAAFRKTDVEVMKANVSRGSIALGEQMAQVNRQTLDQWIRSHSGAEWEENPDIRNERIDGDTATLEVKATKAKDWSTVMFVKEDGKWKIAFDQMFEKAKATPTPKQPL